MTDQEIVELWSKMKVGYPESILSRPNVMEIVRRTFPRLVSFTSPFTPLNVLSPKL